MYAVWCPEVNFFLFYFLALKQNDRFEDSVGLQMASHCTTRKIKSDSPKSVKNFGKLIIIRVL